MKRTAPKPIEKGAAYLCGQLAAQRKDDYKPAETFEWKQGYRDKQKEMLQ